MTYVLFLLPYATTNKMQAQTDESYQLAALREAQEELGIDPARVEMLGELRPVETEMTGRTLVWPFVVRCLRPYVAAKSTYMCMLTMSYRHSYIPHRLPNQR
jgi:hypothetical protein